MKALALREIADIRLEERDIPEIKDDEVLVQIKACGICSSDEDRIFKTGTYHFPTVPGHEFAGKIVKVGKKADSKIVGARASIFPLLPCFECESCKRRRYATCSNYKYFGSRNDGGFSEYLAVPEWNLNLLDESVDYKVGALSEPAAVACHAVKIGGIEKGKTVLIIGTGTIGILIAGICRIVGADPIVVGRRKSSINMVREFGLNSMLIEDVTEYSKRYSIDAVFEAVGTNEAMDIAIKSVKPNGTVIAAGNPKSDFALEKNTYWMIPRKQIRLLGTWNSSFKGEDDDWRTVAELMKKREFPFEKLITAIYRIEEYQEAFDHLKDKSKPKSRIMFVMNEEE